MEICIRVPDKATRDALRLLGEELNERPTTGEAAADVGDLGDETGELGYGGADG